jgi:hypothetical protein
MLYPRGFPQHLQPLIDQAIAEAEADFITIRRNHPSTAIAAREQWISKIFFAFAQQARKAVSEGLWRGEEIRAELEGFLHQLLVDAFYDKKLSSGLFSSFEEEQKRKIKESDLWRTHQLELAEILGMLSKPKSLPHHGSRASWLQERLRERGWGSADASAFGGPDRKTIEKILDGKIVRNDILEKLATALSQKVSEVKVIEIPSI